MVAASCANSCRYLPFSLQHPAFAAQCRAIGFEYERYRYHGRGDAAKEGTSPLYAKIREHLSGEERETSGNGRTQNNVCRDARRSAKRLSVISPNNWLIL
jgi:hypothetical protein